MVREDNWKARKLYERVGFVPEATLIDEYVHPQTQQFINMIRMYQLRPDYTSSVSSFPL
ncbi:MAG: hypothetical protein ACFB0B_17815 [Thermonemataceae bacterium]